MKYDNELKTYEWMVFIRSDNPEHIIKVLEAAQRKAIKFGDVQIIE